jgi:hypothetical protein
MRFVVNARSSGKSRTWTGLIRVLASQPLPPARLRMPDRPFPQDHRISSPIDRA